MGQYVRTVEKLCAGQANIVKSNLEVQGTGVGGKYCKMNYTWSIDQCNSEGSPHMAFRDKTKYWIE